jgi:hypothetical protein
MTNCAVIFIEPVELTLVGLWQLIVNQFSSAGLRDICFATKAQNIYWFQDLFGIESHVTRTISIKV